MRELFIQGSTHDGDGNVILGFVRELPCAKSTGRLNDFIVQTTLAV